MTNDIKASIDKVKEAVCKKETASHLSHYLIEGQRIYATDAAVSASAPYPSKPAENYLVPAAEFEKMLSMVGPAAKLTLGDKFLTISDKGKRAKVQIKEAGNFSKLIPGTDKIAIPATLKAELLQMKRFVSSNSGHMYACCIKIVSDGKETHLLATNNIVLARLECAEPIKQKMDVLITDRILDCIESTKNEPLYIAVTSNTVTFYLYGDSYICGLIPAGGYPVQVGQLLATSVEYDFELSEEWKKCFYECVKVSSEELYVSDTHLKAKKGHAILEYDIPGFSLNGEPTFWSPSYMKSVIDVATHFKVMTNAGYWRGSNIRGLISRKNGNKEEYNAQST